MKPISFRKNLYYLIPIMILIIVIAIGYFYINGIPLFNVPKIEDVSYVEISNHRLDINGRKFTESQDIKMALNLTNTLSYKLGKPEQSNPLIELKFHLKNGKSFIISSNEKTVYVNGNAHRLKNDKGKAFIKLTEGVFFFPDLVKKEDSK